MLLPQISGNNLWNSPCFQLLGSSLTAPHGPGQPKVGPTISQITKGASTDTGDELLYAPMNVHDYILVSLPKDEHLSVGHESSSFHGGFCFVEEPLRNADID